MGLSITRAAAVRHPDTRYAHNPAIQCPPPPYNHMRSQAMEPNTSEKQTRIRTNLEC